MQQEMILLLLDIDPIRDLVKNRLVEYREFEIVSTIEDLEIIKVQYYEDKMFYRMKEIT